MSKLEQIEKSVETLSDEEMKAFGAWFDNLRWQRWDSQIEQDAENGKLDTLANEALAELRVGGMRRI
ncbi:MAG: hypothetical protein ACK4U0_03115 [Mesorhizobium sp.]